MESMSIPLRSSSHTFNIFAIFLAFNELRHEFFLFRDRRRHHPVVARVSLELCVVVDCVE